MTCKGPYRGLPRARVQPQMSREVATFAVYSIQYLPRSEICRVNTSPLIHK